MSKNITCYVVTDTDRKIAEQLGFDSKTKTGAFSPYRVATLRGMHDDANPNSPIDISNISEAAKKISSFRHSIAVGNAKGFKSFGSNLTSDYEKLKISFTAQERFDRVNMIAYLFSAKLDNYLRNNPDATRESILQGENTSHGVRGGEFSIFEAVYNQICDVVSYYANLSKGIGIETFKKQNPSMSDEEIKLLADSRYAKFLAVLENWNALVTHARIKLRNTEGIKLGNTNDYYDDANSNNYEDTEDNFLLEETKRDGWQDKNDQRSAFGSIGKLVRRALGNTYKYFVNDRGVVEVEKDDLGFKRTLDPVRAHQEILDALRGMSDSQDMLNILTNLVDDGMAWLKPVVDYIKTHPEERPTFYRDFKKNMQLFGQIEKKKENGKTTYKTTLLNKLRDRLTPALKVRVKSGVVLGKKSVYNEKGDVDWNNLRDVRASIIDMLGEPKQESGKPKVYGKGGNKFFSADAGLSRLDRRGWLVETSRNLGIDMTADDAENLLRHTADLKEYLKNLYDIVEYGINPLYGVGLNLVEKGESPEARRYEIKNLKKDQSKKGRFLEKIQNMNTILTKGKGRLQIDSRATRRDSNGNSISLYSNINPCFMGDKLEHIQRLIEKDDKAGLAKYLEENYLKSSYFYNREKAAQKAGYDSNKFYSDCILNRWIKDMYQMCTDPQAKRIALSETYLGHLSYMRMVGTPDINFEDFTSKQHAIDMLEEYWSDLVLHPTWGTAQYPVFILGDSGIQKYIRQKVYSADEVINSMYDVYQQELERMQLVRGVNQFLEESGKLNTGKAYKKIKSFSTSDGRFTFLEFLNKDYEAEVVEDGKIIRKTDRYSLPENASEDDVKAVIKAYMDDAYLVFKQKLQNLEVLNLDKYGQYEDLWQHTNPKIVDDENNQYSLKKAFFNLKFATIQQLQFFTIDPAFYKDVKDLQKRYKEIHAPGTVLDIYAVEEQDRNETCVYFDDIENGFEDVDTEYEKFLRNAFGENSDVYKTYKKGMTLTDGQGYRTLESYRKVMIMAGEWNLDPAYEAAYQRIMEIRQKYGHNPIPVAELESLKESTAIFKPLKPYMFTHEFVKINDNDGMLVPVQHKYAEVVLIPELLPEGSKLRDMAYWMEEHRNDNNEPEPIDMVCSTTVVKVGAFGSTKIDHLEDYDNEIVAKTGKKAEEITNSERLSHALNQAYVHKLSYNDYRIQTNVPDHVHQSQLFGTQVRKLIMAGVLKYNANGKIIDNVDENGHYQYEHYVDFNTVKLDGRYGEVRLNGRNLIAFYNNLIVSNILDSYHQFEGIIKDPKKLSDMMIQNIISNNRESVDNIFAYSMTDEEFNMCLFEGGIEHDTAAFLLSIYKKLVNKQKIDGGSGVQASAMGISGYTEDGGLKYVYEYDKNGNPTNILYAETEMPFNLSYKDADGIEHFLDFDEYCNPDGTLKKNAEGKEILELEFPGITNLVAYRIPTERAYSMINLKVVRFSRKLAGGTIKVPSPETTKAGFDFDIDKLYFMRKEFITKADYDKASVKLVSGIFGKSAAEFSSDYDYSKKPSENTRAARNNMILHLIQQRLMDKETLAQRTTPGGFRGASKAARMQRELVFGDLSGITKNGKIDFEALERRAEDKESKDPEPKYDPSDPMTMIVYNQQNQIAAKLIGIFANQNTNHALASLLSRFEVRKGFEIEFAGHTKAEGYGYNLLHGPKGVDVDLNIAEFLAASVDAVKDPVLNFLNFNTLTATAGAFLARTGYSTFEIGLLFNQPIVKEICEYAFNNNLTLSDAIRDKLDKYKKQHILDDNAISIDRNNNTKEALAENIIRFREDASLMNNKDFAKKQLQILSLFKNIVTVSDEVNDFVLSTKFTASNAVKSTFGEMYAQQLKVSNYVKRIVADEVVLDIQLTDLIQDNIPMKDNPEFVTMDDAKYLEVLANNPFAYEQAMFDMNRRALKSFAKYFPYETGLYKGMRQFAVVLTRNGYLDGETINELHRDIPAFLLAQNEQSDFNGNKVINTAFGEMRAKEYYDKYFPRVVTMKLAENPALKNLALFSYMEFTEIGEEEVDEFGNVKDTEKTITMNINDIGGLQSYQMEEIKESWEELEKIDPELAEGLFFFNFHKKGFDFSPLTFMNLVPVAVKKAIIVPVETYNPATRKYEIVEKSYDTFLRELLRGERAINNVEFIKQFLANHIDNKYLIYHAKSTSAKNVLTDKMFKAGQLVTDFELDVTNLTKEQQKIFILDKNEQTVAFVPAIEFEGNLFIADGPTFNQSTGTMRYTRADMSGINKYTKKFVKSGETVEATSSATPSLDTPNGDSSKNVSNRQEIIEVIAESYAAVAKDYVGLRDEMTGEVKTLSDFISFFSQMDDAFLKEHMEQVKESVRNNGVLTFNLNENGEIVDIKLC